MADNVILNAPTSTGDTIAADEISSAKYQRIKLIFGADGSNDGDVSTTNRFPVSSQRTDGTHLEAPGQITLISASSISSTGTGNCAAVTGLAFYKELMLQVDVTAVAGGSTPTLKLYLQTSCDGGSKWDDMGSATFTTSIARKMMYFSGENGSATSVTDAADGTISDNTCKQGAWGDRLRMKYIYTHSGTPSGSFTVDVKGVVK